MKKIITNVEGAQKITGEWVVSLVNLDKLSDDPSNCIMWEKQFDSSEEFDFAYKVVASLMGTLEEREIHLFGKERAQPTITGKDFYSLVDKVSSMEETLRGLQGSAKNGA